MMFALQNVRKSKSSYIPCNKSGIIDDMSDPFPFTSSGSQWQGITDRVLGGSSNGSLSREEDIGGRKANVLRGNIECVVKSEECSLDDNGGFIQMATDLSLDPSTDLFVDLSDYDGVELDVYCEGTNAEDNFNVHLRTPICERQNSSFRSSFSIQPGQWTTVRLPWSEFEGYGPGCQSASFNEPLVSRLGVVAIGEPRDVTLAVAKVGLYNVF